MNFRKSIYIFKLNRTIPLRESFSGTLVLRIRSRTLNMKLYDYDYDNGERWI
jgi:hypothetical protein